MLSHAKMRTCAIGPELVLHAVFEDARGSVRVEREGASIWSRDVATGSAQTLFSLAEMERNLFQYDAHRVPGDVHIHYLGGSVSSFGDGVRLQAGDQVVIEWQGYGRALRNLIDQAGSEPAASA